MEACTAAPRTGVASPQRTPRALPRRCVVQAAATRTIELDGGAVAVAPDGRRRPRGLVHFLGGAFVGATPHLVYPLLIEELAAAGYTTVATPYAVTFDHIESARSLNAAFEAAVRQLPRSLGDASLPTFGVGHSNGALLHALAGAVVLPQLAGRGSGSGSGSSSGGGGRQRRGNVLMSFNNLQVKEAVPVPLDSLQPLVQQLRGQDRLRALAQRGLQQAADAAAQLLAAPGGGAGDASAAVAAQLAGLRQWDPALVQLGSVFDEVGDGSTDFSPPPVETRRLIASGYAVPATLLVQFTDDNTDESPEAEALLCEATAARSGGGGGGGGAAPSVMRLLLPGTHLTPCGADVRWGLRAGQPFGPADALAAAAKAALQADSRRLASRVVSWLDSQAA